MSNLSPCRQCSLRLALIGMIASLAALVGCGEPATETIALVDFDLRQLTFDPVAPMPLAEPAWALHWLEHNWDASPDSAKGVWAYGPEATARLELMGRRARLHLVLSTTPALSQDGLTCDVLLNDHLLTAVTLDSAWTDHVVDVAVPDESLRRGGNTLTLRPSIWNQTGQPHAVYVREMTVFADLTAREQKRWLKLIEAPPCPKTWAMDRSEDLPEPLPASRQPDVLMVLLDATWAAHASCYGYHRETTPNMDALAAEAVVVEHCHSVAPFTIIAVPTLHSGRHWREHGITGQGQALADSFVTLAECLDDAGYLTLGYSGNPYVSQGSGASQGFDEFSEFWMDPEYGGPGLTPELGEKRFLARIGAGLGEQPVFAYLHLMPPHAPYFPGPEHDLWSDPDYAGAYDGTAEQLDIADTKRLTLSDEDRQHVTDLYDGNLHRIDASMGRIIDGWRDLERDRELLIIVLSDHGEAFGEHGWYQHLSTVYDEMVHVPLVLWPREAWADVAPDHERLLSLTDVYPLVLRQLGVAPPAHLHWTDRTRRLLAGKDVKSARVLLRTNVSKHTYGLRTERYLAVFDGLTKQELFDLERDPGATVNLRADKPELYRKLVGEMRAILGARQPVAAPGHVISEQEQRALKSLGY